MKIDPSYIFPVLTRAIIIFCLYQYQWHFDALMLMLVVDYLLEMAVNFIKTVNAPVAAPDEIEDIPDHLVKIAFDYLQANFLMLMWVSLPCLLSLSLFGSPSMVHVYDTEWLKAHWTTALAPVFFMVCIRIVQLIFYYSSKNERPVAEVILSFDMMRSLVFGALLIFAGPIEFTLEFIPVNAQFLVYIFVLTGDLVAQNFFNYDKEYVEL